MLQQTFIVPVIYIVQGSIVVRIVTGRRNDKYSASNYSEFRASWKWFKIKSFRRKAGGTKGTFRQWIPTNFNRPCTIVRPPRPKNREASRRLAQITITTRMKLLPGERGRECTWQAARRTLRAARAEIVLASRTLLPHDKSAKRERVARESTRLTTRCTQSTVGEGTTPCRGSNARRRAAREIYIYTRYRRDLSSWQFSNVAEDRFLYRDTIVESFFIGHPSTLSVPSLWS